MDFTGSITRFSKLLLALALLCALPARAANICDQAVGTQCAKVDPQGGLSVHVEAAKQTYSAGTTALTASAAGTGVFWSVCGSATKTVKVQYISMSGRVATAAAVATVVLTKTSAAPTGGTPSALTVAPLDSNFAAGSATSTLYTALATAGANVGVIGTQSGSWPILATSAATDIDPIFVWDFTRRTEAETVVLRGVAQCIQAAMGATTTNAPSFAIHALWTEE